MTEPITTKPSIKRRDARRNDPPPWYLILPALLVGLGVLIPLGYLVVRATEGDHESIREMLLRRRLLTTMLNTLGLAAAVLATTTVLAMAAAWLVVRTDLPGRKLLTPALVMPLAVPGYLLAFTLLSIGGDYGASARMLGITLPRLSGFTGSWIALSLYNFPYMFLTLRAGFASLDHSLEDAARSLGRGPVAAFFSAVLPQLRPAILAGSLLVVLHVVGDFGVVSLMRFTTFSYDLYNSLTYEPAYAAWIALLMLSTLGTFIGLELWLMRGRRLDRAGVGASRSGRRVQLGHWKWLALFGLAGFLMVGVGVPVITSVYWSMQPTLDYVTIDVTGSALDSITVSLPAALASTLLAVPIAFLSVRYRGKRAQLLERFSYVGYATPGLALGLALVWFTLWLDGFIVDVTETLFYQSLFIMIYAYTLHFLAEAVGPVRASLLKADRRYEEASRSLGWGRIATFFRITLPLIRDGLIAATALVFLSCMKELPIALMLRPYDFDTLAFNLWDLTNEASYAEAAPYALAILVVSFCFVLTLLSTRKINSQAAPAD